MSRETLPAEAYDKHPGSSVDEPAFIIQPDEMRAYKELRMIIDTQFLNCKPFWSPNNVYSNFVPSPEGVDLYLRSSIFPLFNKFEAYEKDCRLSDNNKTVSCYRAGMKLTQRENKQKDRSESRLLSLLFAAVYDINTRKCFLLKHIPPLRIFRHDKNGKPRRVSNFNEVRAFLRHTVTRSISLHANATRTMFELGPEHILLLPVTTVSIARAFLLFHYNLDHIVIKSQQENDNSCATASATVHKCLDAVCDFIKDWERRNYTSDIELSCSLQATRSHALYKATETLLLSMIKVLPPSEPTIEVFKKGVVYNHGIVGDNECKPGKHKSCAVCDLSLQVDNAFHGKNLISSATACRQYVDAICKCISLQPPALRTLNHTLGVENDRAPIWKSIISTISVHRLQSLSREAEHRSGSFRNQARVAEFIEAVRWDVARMWIALDTSNKDTTSFITDLKVEGNKETLQAVIEIIMGTTLTTRALFEEPERIKKVLQALRQRTHDEQLKCGSREQHGTEHMINTDSDPALSVQELTSSPNGSNAALDVSSRKQDSLGSSFTKKPDRYRRLACGRELPSVREDKSKFRAELEKRDVSLILPIKKGRKKWQK